LSARSICFSLTFLLLGGCAGNSPSLQDLERVAGAILNEGGALSSEEIARGLREALSIGTSNVSGQLGQQDGFYGDQNIRIPLPNALASVRDVAAKVGLSGTFDTLEQRLNRAAEVAAPRAGHIFIESIKQMTVADAQQILRGPDDAATQYFRRTSGSALAAEIEPVVNSSLAQVGAVRVFNQLMDRYRQIPLAPKVDANLTDHVVEKAMDGIFFYVAREEKAIRENPLKRTTQLLQRVFSQLD